MTWNNMVVNGLLTYLYGENWACASNATACFVGLNASKTVRLAQQKRL